MIEELIVSAVVGASLGNAWACALVSLSCSMESKKAGLAFISGRFIGLMLLGAAVAGLGLVELLRPTYLLVAFGVLTLALGAFVLVKTLNKRSMHMHGRPLIRLLHGRRHRAQCERSLMADGGEVRSTLESKPTAVYVFLLGVMRGATPCVKIMVLAPILISVDFGLAMLMVVVFALASTMYPVIGFLSGNILRQSKRYAFHVRVGAALIMVILGIYFVVNALGGPAH